MRMARGMASRSLVPCPPQVLFLVVLVNRYLGSHKDEVSWSCCCFEFAFDLLGGYKWD